MSQAHVMAPCGSWVNKKQQHKWDLPHNKQQIFVSHNTLVGAYDMPQSLLYCPAAAQQTLVSVSLEHGCEGGLAHSRMSTS